MAGAFAADLRKAGLLEGLKDLVGARARPADPAEELLIGGA